jgi:Leu/Phe-tRNA-protein transferase
MDTRSKWTRDQIYPTHQLFSITIIQQPIDHLINHDQSIILPMEKSLNKAKSIQKAVEAYQYDLNLSYRSATIMYGCASQSVIDYNISEKSYISNRYVANQKLSSTEESALVVHIKKVYNTGFPLIIRYFNEFANEFLRMRNSIDIINKN